MFSLEKRQLGMVGFHVQEAEDLFLVASEGRMKTNGFKLQQARFQFQEETSCLLGKTFQRYEIFDFLWQCLPWKVVDSIVESL